MSGDGRKGLVVLLGVEDLQQIFDHWPDRMNLAVCLNETGHCCMLVFREDEGRRCLPRLKRALGRDTSEVCFFPEIEGFPTRKLLFSEEKFLLNLVQNSPEIVEEAADYSVNYSFAVEEGLDPVIFLHHSQNKRSTKSQTAELEPAWAHTEKAEASAVHHIVPAKTGKDTKKSYTLPSELPRFLQKVARVDPGSTFQSVGQIKNNSLVPQDCLIHGEEGGWIKIDLEGCSSSQVIVSNPGQIFVRDDRRVMALHSSLIGSEPKSLPGQILLSVKHLPIVIRDRLARNIGLSKLTFEQGFIFITLDNFEPSLQEDVAPRTKKVSTKPHWKLWASAGFIVASLALFLQSTSPPRLFGVSENSINWNQFRTGAKESRAESIEQSIRRLGG